MPVYPLAIPLWTWYDFICNEKLQNTSARKIPMTDNQEQKRPEELLESNDAVKYLAQKWGMKSYGLIAFRSLRLRNGIEPTMKSRTSAWFSKELLDSIPRPTRGRRPKSGSKRDNNEGEEGRNSSVTYPTSSFLSHADEAGGVAWGATA